MGINLYRGNISCWSCGPKNRVDVLSQLLGLAPHQVRGLLGELTLSVLPEADRPRAKGKVEVPFLTVPFMPAHRKYLLGRDFDPRKISKVWGVQGIGQFGGRFAWRLFIPVVLNGELVSWTTRGIHESQNRYLSASLEQEKVNHKHLLYGEDYALGQSVIVCEGPTDVWRVGHGAVATFGTGYTKEQLLRLTRYRRVVVCFDKADEAQVVARRLVDELAPFGGEVMNVRLEADDPGSATKKEIDQLRELAFGEATTGRNR